MGLGGREGPAHLARNLPFTDNQGLKAGADGKQMFRDGGAVDRIERRPDITQGQIRTMADGIQGVAAGGSQQRGGPDLTIDFETVARGQDHASNHGAVAGDQMPRHPCRGSLEPGCAVHIKVAVFGRQDHQHWAVPDVRQVRLHGTQCSRHVHSPRNPHRAALPGHTLLMRQSATATLWIPWEGW